MPQTRQLILPGRFGQTKPPGIPRIDWTHPLARGLVFYGFDTGTGLIIDLARGRGMNKISTWPSPQPSYRGQGQLWNASGSAYFNSDAEIRNVTGSPPWTAAEAFIKTGNVAAYAQSLNRTANNGRSNPYINWGFQHNRGGVGQNYLDLFLTSASTFYDLGTTSSVVTNQFTSAAIVASSSSAASCYFNGSLLNSATGLTIGSTNTNDAILFGGADATTSYLPFAGFVFYGAFWSRALSAAELLQLHVDPYCFLRFPAQVTPWEVRAPTGGGTPVATDSSSSLEFGAPLHHSAPCALEAPAGIGVDTQEPFAFVRSLLLDDTYGVGFLAQVRSHPQVLLEDGVRLIPVAPISVEGLSRVASDGGLPGESAGSILVLRDTIPPIELLGSSRRIVAALAEATSALSSTQRVSTELPARQAASHASPAEWRGAVLVVVGEPGTFEYATIAQHGATVSIECLTGGASVLLSDEGLPLEWRSVPPAMVVSLNRLLTSSARVRLITTPGRIRWLKRE